MFQAIRSSRFLTRLWAVAMLATLLAVSVGFSGVIPAMAAPVTYYIDCAAGNDANNGTSTSTPWRTFANVNSRTLVAGDSVLLNRGTTCVGIGSLIPKGNGTPSSPITIGAYGTGALPIINCGTGTPGTYSCVFVLDYEGYVIRDLEVTGAKVDSKNGPAGIYLESSISKKSYFRITNVVAHGLWYGISVGGYKYGSGGNAYNQSIGNNPGYLDDVIVDGVEAYNNGGNTGNGGKGIEVAGNYSGGGFEAAKPLNTNVTVRNSNLHDNQGDGIVMASTDGSLMEFLSANRNGFLADDRYGIWPWNGKNSVTQFSEAAFNETGTNKGGGGFDCDYNVWGCTFQYSYAHDNEGPGQLLIGYGNTNILDNGNVRYNLFVDNCWHAVAPDCGDVVSFGTVFNTHYHNNTVYFKNRNNNPGEIAAIYLSTWGKFGSPSNFNYKNNIVYLTNNSRAYWQEVGGTYAFDYNLLYAESGNLNISWGKSSYSTLAAFQAATGQDAHSKSGNPLLSSPGGRNTTDYQIANNSPAVNCGVDLGAALMGTRDYFGNAIPAGGAYDIGFHETSGTGTCSGGPAPTNTPGGATATPTRTNTPVPPTNTPGGPTNTPAPTNTPTRTNTPAPTATPGGSTVMHVQDIWTTDAAGTPKTVFNRGEYVFWHFKIVDQNNNPVSGATVNHHTTKADGTGYDVACISTNANGECVQDKKIGNADPVGTWTTAVTNVVKTGATYNASANVKTSVNFTVQ